jgi:GGDEF domain-containing protein
MFKQQRLFNTTAPFREDWKKMKSAERMYANILLQLLSVCFLSLYLMVTSQVYPTNYLWFIATILLGLFGYFRKTYPTLLATLFVIAVYGTYIIFQLYVKNAFATIGWNDIIWLFTFPFIALIAGINKSDIQFKQKGRKQTAVNKAFHDSALDEPFVIDEELGFKNHENFFQQFEEEIFLGGRNKRKLSLMLIEIYQFQDFYKEYGYEQTQLFLDKVAELVNEIMPEVEVKAYLNEGQFAVLLSGSERANSSIAELWLDDHFNSLLLTRPRSKGSVTARLRHSKVDCPAQGMTAYAIVEKAQQELSFSSM